MERHEQSQERPVEQIASSQKCRGRWSDQPRANNGKLSKEDGKSRKQQYSFRFKLTNDRII